VTTRLQIPQTGRASRSPEVGAQNMENNENMLVQEIDKMIAHFKIRVQQERIHVSQLSANPSQQATARFHLAAIVTGLAKLQDYRKRFN
jgi:hypothetical protein